MTIRRLPINPAWSPEKRNRDTWERGHPVYTTPIIVRGIIKFGYAHKANCRIWTEVGSVHVFWFLKRIPTDVQDGDRITICGNFETANMGTAAFIRDALIIPQGYTRMMSEVSEVITRYLLKPKSYINESEVPDGGD
jgi:hypothetical protein